MEEQSEGLSSMAARRPPYGLDVFWDGDSGSGGLSSVAAHRLRLMKVYTILTENIYNLFSAHTKKDSQGEFFAACMRKRGEKI